MTQLQALTYPSSNSKTGRIAVSTTARPSCPPTCPMRAACYADAGYYTRMHWDKVSDGTRGVEWHRVLFALRRLPDGAYFRHNVAGDLWQTPAKRQISVSKLRQLREATDHLGARWTYTHHKRSAANLRAVKYSNAMGFTVNLSTENRDDAAMLATKGHPVTCVVPEDAKANGRHLGVRFVQCPATREGSTVTCETCGGCNGKPLCSKADRDFVITFPAHGSRSARVPATCS